MTPEHKAKLNAGRERYFAENKGKRRARKQKAPPGPVARFNIDSLGTLCVYEADGITGVELDPETTSALAAFLRRVHPAPSDPSVATDA